MVIEWDFIVIQWNIDGMITLWLCQRIENGTVDIVDEHIENIFEHHMDFPVFSTFLPGRVPHF